MFHDFLEICLLSVLSHILTHNFIQPCVYLYGADTALASPHVMLFLELLLTRIINPVFLNSLPRTGFPSLFGMISTSFSHWLAFNGLILVVSQLAFFRHYYY
jgi:hypothetical protein